MTETTDTRYMTTEEVAELTRLKPGTLRSWRHSNSAAAPPSFTLGSRVLYAREDVEAWIAAQRNSTRG